jgi:fibronectin-binding autotransporter adhesin
MPFVFRQATYRLPGVYQWVKPSIAVGSGPQGSTYLQTIITVIGAGTGGIGGGANNNQNTGIAGGSPGPGGGYVQATYLPASLNAFEDIVVGAHSPGTIGGSVSGTTVAAQNSAGTNASGASNFGAHIIAGGGSPASVGNGGSNTVTGGLNIVNNAGGFILVAASQTYFQNTNGPSIKIGGVFSTWQPTGNSSGGAGGSANELPLPAIHNGGWGAGVYPQLFGGSGQVFTNGKAQNGTVPGAGGGACWANQSIFPLGGGDGAKPLPNSGAGGGGGGGASSQFNAGGLITGGKGADGSDGLVQVTDIFQLPPTPPFYVFDLEIIAWYHMMNMARPISLTGRYKS